MNLHHMSAYKTNFKTEKNQSWSALHKTKTWEDLEEKQKHHIWMWHFYEYKIFRENLRLSQLL